MNDSKWDGCPYNYYIHKEKVEKMEQGKISKGVNHNDYNYHVSRLERCYDWLMEKEKA